MAGRAVFISLGPDSTDPVVSDGTISASSITNTGFLIDFNVASDDYTNAADLVYSLYVAPSGSPMSTPVQILSNGTLASQDTNVTTLSASGLTKGTDYEVNILVADGRKNRVAYTPITVTTTGLAAITVSTNISTSAQVSVFTQSLGANNRTGDEAALDALAGSLGNLPAGWTPPISLSSPPTGVTVDTINSELRVTEIDLKAQGLTGDIEVAEIGNLKEMDLFAVHQNSLDSQIPPELFTIGMKMRYCYLCIGDETEDPRTELPHEAIATPAHVYPKYYHPGKHKANEENIWRGPIPSEIHNLRNTLEYFCLSWTDDWTGRTFVGATPLAKVGITVVPDEIFDMPAMKMLQLQDNWNIAESGNKMNLPATFANMTSITNIAVGGGSGSDWDEDSDEWLRGTFPDLSGWTQDVAQFTFSRQGELTGFPNLRNCGDLKGIGLKYTKCFANLDFSDIAWLVDGRFPGGDLYALDWPNNGFGNGLQGNIPEFGVMSGMDLLSLNGNGLTGVVPYSLFTTNPNGIKKLDLRENQLTGIGDNDFTFASNMTDYNFLRNEMSGPWPYLDWDDPAGDLRAGRFEDNKYNFADMLFIPPNAPGGETCFELWDSLNLNSFSYSPQKQLGDQNALSGNTIDFSDVFTHADNVYEWRRNGSIISGETDNTLDVSGYNPDDDFYLSVTNPGVSGLTIRTVTITI